MKKLIIILMLLMLVSLAWCEDNLRMRTIHWLQGYNLSPEAVVLIISMLPIIELRGSIPVGMLLFGFPWWKAALLSIAGNMVPIPLVLLGWNGLVRILSRYTITRKPVEWLFRRTQRKSSVIEKYQEWGLAIFVGIPLPGTGAWTGAMAACLFSMKFWKSMLYIFYGVLMAAVAITTLSQVGYFAVQ